MALEAGTRLGTFEVLSPLGAGGMGEVYRAHDTELGREVALKLLPEGLSHDPERLARLKREARTLAALNHPGIATVHGIGDAEGTSFVVMELVEGPTLAERLEQGALPVDEALELGRQIAAALQAAHERTIIHRDLKPANVKLTTEGQVKLLDFGLAKVSAVGAVDSEGPTATPEGTAAGVVVGTAAHMSPEQARGQELDRRTDVWSFGCVLYEMLTGRRAFAADTVSDTLVRVLEREPNWDALPETTPTLIRSLVRRCLRKDRAKRLHDIADARIEIEEALTEPGGPSSATVSAAATPTDRSRMAYWAAGILAVALVGVIVWMARRPTPPAPHSSARLSIVPSRKAPLPAVNAFGNRGVLAFSPDGTRLVYVALVGETTQLYLRPMDQLEATPIPGTEGAVTPFFSPDGESVGFWQEERLWKVPLEGGVPSAIGDGEYHGASWGPDGTVLVVGDFRSGLSRVSKKDGVLEIVTTPNAAGGEFGHRWPQILPGGKAALFTIQADTGRHDDCRIGLLSLETGEWRLLLEGGTFARYLPSGHVIYTRYGSLLAVPFDLQRLEVTGEPTQVLEDVAMYATGYARLAVSTTGSLAYVRGRYAPPDRSLVWVDRQGNTTLVAEERRAYQEPRVSPDGTRLAVVIATVDAQDVWVLDLRRGTWTRLTFGKDHQGLVWSPDGEWLVFTSNREGARYLFRSPADGSAPPERLSNSPAWAYASDWSPDGRFLLLTQPADRGRNLTILSLEEGTDARSYQTSEFDERWAHFSPDGRWVAYVSNESGRDEIYVRSFPDPGRKVTVSVGGGSGVRWSRDGRELLFPELDEKRMMVTAVRTEPTFRAEPPALLFESTLPIASYNWDIMLDGQRFVVVLSDEEEPEPEQIVIIPDFASELEQRVRAVRR